MAEQPTQNRHHRRRSEPEILLALTEGVGVARVSLATIAAESGQSIDETRASSQRLEQDGYIVILSDDLILMKTTLPIVPGVLSDIEKNILRVVVNG